MTKEIIEGKLDTLSLEAAKQQRKVLLEDEIQEMSGLEIQALRELQEISALNDTIDYGKSLRGKSAKSIEMQLKTEVFKNLSRAHEMADIRKLQKEVTIQQHHHHHAHREESEHRQIIEEMQTNLTDMEKITEPLSALKRQLKCYEEKTSNYFSDTRYTVEKNEKNFSVRLTRQLRIHSFLKSIKLIPN